MEKRTTLIPTLAQLERAGHDDHKLLAAAEMNIQRLINGAEMGGNKHHIREAKRFMRRLEKRRAEWFHGGAEATPATSDTTPTKTVTVQSSNGPVDLQVADYGSVKPVTYSPTEVQ